MPYTVYYSAHSYNEMMMTVVLPHTPLPTAGDLHCTGDNYDTTSPDFDPDERISRSHDKSSGSHDQSHDKPSESHDQSRDNPSGSRDQSEGAVGGNADQLLDSLREV